MPLPETEVSRELRHTRRIRYEGYKRADGLWDIEAHITDIKNHDFQLRTGVRRAGQPVHSMWVRVTIDRKFTIVAAVANSDAVPYPGCEAIAPAYGKLVGLSLVKDFRRRVREILGGVRGCTHLTEMLGGLPTAAIQTFAGEMAPEESEEGRKPFQLDQCHALETSSEVVRNYYPKWYRPREKA
ncbi:MAG TPA: DUF2889 domain-containing protein [Burkholderiales bacterium]|nr:DUF2889 domain-containing protein [Burkholderiales bacterium]